MSETTTEQVQQEQQQPQTEQQQQAPAFNPFADNSWTENKPSQEGQFQEQQPQAELPQANNNAQEVEEEEVVDADEWLKSNFGWENTDSAKAELEELRKLRESASTKEEIKFANEQSEKFYRLLQEGKEDDLYDFLQEKKKIEKLTSAELDENLAAEVIKTNMQKKYKDLTASEIEYKFNKQFGIPAKPVQQDIETDEEYQQRLSNWEEKANDIRTEMMIEAKLAKPELERLKSELRLPDIKGQNEGNQGYSQEELAAHEKLVNSFKDSAKSALNSFDGFNVSVKDEEVDIPLSYAISQEEKSAIAEQIERFADSNFDANAILADRWLTEDNQLNTAQMIKDLALLYSEGKMNQKFANDAASKRLAEHIRRTSNISVSSRTPQQTFSPEQKSDFDKQVEYIWKNS
jgi:hypothetical protein